MKQRIWLIIMLLLSVLTGCKDKEKSPRDRMLPSITGRIGEVMVVCTESLWQSEVRKKTEEILAEAYPALPQEERMFDIIRVSPSNFEGLYESHRNILWIQTDPDIDSAIFRIEKSRYAKEQLIIWTKSPDKESLLDLLEENKQRIQSLFNGIERKRLLSIYKKDRNQNIHQHLASKHNILLNVPKGFHIDVDSNNFIWLTNDTEYDLKGIWIYYYPYTDTLTFTRDFLIQKRNEIGKEYVPGGKPGSFMQTEILYPPHFNQFIYNDQYFAELRGLWKMEGGIFMGGPFMSLTTLDKKRNRIITVEVYVFAPNTRKRNFIRNIEAIPYSLQIK